MVVLKIASQLVDRGGFVTFQILVFGCKHQIVFEIIQKKLNLTLGVFVCFCFHDKFLHEYGVCDGIKT